MENSKAEKYNLLNSLNMHNSRLLIISTLNLNTDIEHKNKVHVHFSKLPLKLLSMPFHRYKFLTAYISLAITYNFLLLKLIIYFIEHPWSFCSNT